MSRKEDNTVYNIYRFKSTTCKPLEHLVGMLGTFYLDDNEGCPIGQKLKWGLDEVAPLFPNEPQYGECRFDFIYGGEIVESISDRRNGTVTIKTDVAEYVFEFTNYEIMV